MRQHSFRLLSQAAFAGEEVDHRGGCMATPPEPGAGLPWAGVARARGMTFDGGRPRLGATAGLSSSVGGAHGMHCWTSQQWHPIASLPYWRMVARRSPASFFWRLLRAVNARAAPRSGRALFGQERPGDWFRVATRCDIPRHAGARAVFCRKASWVCGFLAATRQRDVRRFARFRALVTGAQHRSAGRDPCG
jgi:hypothetical protein